DPRCQSHRRVQLLPRGNPAHARAQIRPHREHRLDRRQRRESEHDRLLGHQSRGNRIYQVAGQGSRDRRNLRERCRAGGCADTHPRPVDGRPDRLHDAAHPHAAHRQAGGDRGGGALPGQSGLFLRDRPVLRRQRRTCDLLMIARRTVVLGLALAIAGWAGSDAVEFVQLSDIHIAKFKTAHPGLAKELEVKKDGVAHFFSALENLRRDIAPSFLLITGDLSDAYGYEGADGNMVYGQFDPFKSIFDRSPIPIYPVLGNHDITQYKHAADKPKPTGDQSVAADARKEWQRLIPNFRDGTYYTFVKRAGGTEYLFLVLDDGDGPHLHAEYVAQQLRWIQKQIAARPHEPIILAMHIPLLQSDFWPAIKPVLADAPNVVLSIAGHRHS